MGCDAAPAVRSSGPPVERSSSMRPSITPSFHEYRAGTWYQPEDTVRKLVESRIQGRDLGYLGDPTVNVLQLNLALAQLTK